MKKLFLTVIMLTLMSSNCFAVGTLFTTPAQRNNLNLMRNGSLGQVIAPTNKTKKQIKLNGFVKRQNGINTAWINNIPTDEHGDHYSEVDLHAINKNNVKLSMPDGSGSIELRPGQVVDLTKNKIIEGYQRPLSRPAETPITGDSEAEQKNDGQVPEVK